VRIDKKRLVPEDKGRVLTAFLESFFARYVEYDFTAGLEEQLDRISNNELAWRDLLRDFWQEFTNAVGDIKDLRVAQVIDALDEMLAPHLFPPNADGTDPRQCPNCGTGRLSLKLGRFGGFIGCTNYPECRYTRQFSAGANASPDKKLGADPATGFEVTLRSGRFGPYLQLGEAINGEKPKRSGLPKGLSADDIDLDRALGLLSLPREVGKHPDNGEPIMAGIGRFGPYVQNGKTYANLETGDDILNIGLNRAVTLIEEKKAKGPGKGRFGADPGRALGEHPEKGGPVVVKNGRYGPYVSHDGVNATLPSDITPETVTLEQALPLLEARAARGGGKKSKRSAKAAKTVQPSEQAAGEKKATKAKSKAKKAVAAKTAIAEQAPITITDAGKAPAAKANPSKAKASQAPAPKASAAKAVNGAATNGAKALKAAGAAKAAAKGAPAPASKPGLKQESKSASKAAAKPALKAKDQAKAQAQPKDAKGAR
jgi:DNA topoisomerase-1